MKQILARDVEVGDTIMVNDKTKSFENVIEVRPSKSNIEIETVSNTYDISPIACVVIRG